jgi:hypothetical protein
MLAGEKFSIESNGFSIEAKVAGDKPAAVHFVLLIKPELLLHVIEIIK